MDKTELQSLVADGLSTRQIASTLGCSQTNIRYWLGIYELKTSPKGKSHFCSVCKTTDPKKFYGHKRSICGQCHNQYVIQKGRERKAWAVELLGGECSRCGYSKSMAALCFHHTDPLVKSPTFASMRAWSSERIEKELKTCILVCANCHAEIHEEISA